MPLAARIGPDSISRLERAAPCRLAEAGWLAQGGHALAAIYLYGYVVEIVIGTAYYRVLGYGTTEVIPDNRLKTILGAARSRSRAEDKAHPIDGLARLLVEDKALLSPPAYGKKMECQILEQAALVCEHWGPRLRYRALQPTSEELTAVRGAADWFHQQLRRI